MDFLHNHAFSADFFSLRATLFAKYQFILFVNFLFLLLNYYF